MMSSSNSPHLGEAGRLFRDPITAEQDYVIRLGIATWATTALLSQLSATNGRNAATPHPYEPHVPPLRTTENEDADSLLKPLNRRPPLECSLGIRPT